MNVKELLQEGRVGKGKLEKFADGCNAMARGLWLGRKVKLIKDGEHYKVKNIEEQSATVTSCWMETAKATLGIYPIGVLFAAIILLAYVITCIPVAAAMGVGLTTKKIALAVDDKSKEYQKVANKYLDFVNKKDEARTHQPNIDKINKSIQDHNVKIKELEALNKVNNTDINNIIAKYRMYIVQSERLIQLHQKPLNRINEDLERLTKELVELKMQDFE